MKPRLKKIISPFLQWWFKKHYTKPRLFSHQNIDITIVPGVFPPQYTFSTKLLLKHLETLNIKGKTFLELGCGSGIISLIAVKKKALVTATDINEKALNELEKSAVKNGLKLKIIKSDLFDNITESHFDYIFINPPYYPKAPKSIEENAWFCGENFEYFEELFQQLPKYIQSKNNVIMILSKDCNIEKIQSIANSNNMNLNTIKVEKKIWETNYIFRVTKK